MCMTSITTEQAIEKAKNYISNQNITDEDLQQELYLAALVAAKNNATEEFLDTSMKHVVTDFHSDENSISMEEYDVMAIDRLHSCCLSDNILLKADIENLIKHIERRYWNGIDIHRNIDIFKYFYGICGRPKLTQQELSKMFNLCPYTIHRIIYQCGSFARRVSRDIMHLDMEEF